MCEEYEVDRSFSGPPEQFYVQRPGEGVLKIKQSGPYPDLLNV